VDELLLGLDIGTSSSKAVLARPDGTLVDAVEKAHTVSLRRPGWVEHDAESVWWADVLALLARFDERKRAAVRGICISGIGPCLLPIGAKAVLPYFAGERTPLFDPMARGAMLGLTQLHGRGHLYRALLEATAFGVRHNLQAVQGAGGDPRRLVAVDGGTRGGLWAQVVSDVTGREQDLPEPSIGASYGDAHLAGTAAGMVPLDARWAKVAGTVRPNVALQPLYDQLYQVYLQLYPATKSLAHELAELQLAAPTPTPQLS
jgi:sugar (pentulose or hexulose) kinase